ncbi:MAG: helix-turn-helix transcriptional regulator [Chloroflexi bacterium]|nr:helix-turn-helix transcriptional regulator [Chloroflexota bacterium]
MSDARKPDRRIERTMTALRDALMALIIDKGYDAISIQDIADRANVARATFYLHFKDKDDLMFRSMRAIYEDLFARQQTASSWESLADDSDFQHVAQYADFYGAMLSPRGSMGFLPASAPISSQSWKVAVPVDARTGRAASAAAAHRRPIAPARRSD